MNLKGTPGDTSGGGPSAFATSLYFMAATSGGVFCYAGTPVGDNCCLFGGSGAMVPAALDGGTVTLTNNTRHQSATYAWDSSENDYGFPSADLEWDIGESLTVSTTGATAPGFTATTTFPQQLAGVVTPQVSLSNGWTVSWTPAGATTVEVYLSSSSGEQLACHAPDAAGQLTFTPDILAAGVTAGAGDVILERKNLGTAKDNAQLVLEPQTTFEGDVQIVP